MTNARNVAGIDLESHARDLGVNATTLVEVAVWRFLKVTRDRRLEVVSEYFKELSEEEALDEYERGNGYRLPDG